MCSRMAIFNSDVITRVHEKSLINNDSNSRFPDLFAVAWIFYCELALGNLISNAESSLIVILLEHC